LLLYVGYQAIVKEEKSVNLWGTGGGSGRAGWGGWGGFDTVQGNSVFEFLIVARFAVPIVSLPRYQFARDICTARQESDLEAVPSDCYDHGMMPRISRSPLSGCASVVRLSPIPFFLGFRVHS
jgi:hypothetical protein